ncbi:MAG: hypothetical protein GY801_00320 [bacterium]|nr:hypothetical protein [bacterium]
MNEMNVSDLLRVEKARWRLAVTWFPCGGLIFLILIGQSIGGAYGDQVQRAWGWALPNFLPTLALMVSVFAADALRPFTETATYVRKNFFYLAVGLSIFYILAILLSLVAPLFAYQVSDAPDLITARLELLEMSNIWLAPLQSLVVASLGVLFFLKEGESHGE